jgi:hypothetical protein
LPFIRTEEQIGLAEGLKEVCRICKATKLTDMRRHFGAVLQNEGDTMPFDDGITSAERQHFHSKGERAEGVLAENSRSF